MARMLKVSCSPFFKEHLLKDSEFSYEALLRLSKRETSKSPLSYYGEASIDDLVIVPYGRQGNVLGVVVDIVEEQLDPKIRYKSIIKILNDSDFQE